MIQISVSQARQDFLQIANQVYGGEEFLVTKNKIPWLTINPIKKEKRIIKRKIYSKAFGMWKNRWPQNKSSVDIVNEWRKEILYGKYGS